MSNEDKSGCRTALGIGCGVVLLLIVLAGVAVAVNWDKMKSIAQSATATLQDVQAANAAVRAEFDTQAVAAHIQHQAGESRFNIVLINPPFLESTDQDQLEAKAKEVATVARNAMADPGAYPKFQVTFIERSTGKGAVTIQRTFEFTASELPPMPEPGQGTEPSEPGTTREPEPERGTEKSGG